MELGSFKVPCGCEQRKEIMGSGNWKPDAIAIGLVVVIAVAIYYVGVKG